MLSLSKNALLGLGHQLIKLASLNYNEGYHIHVDPCESNFHPQVLGFFRIRIVQN
ncbi:Imm32 family immunity protein [Cohnella cellulosilytica]|uniref:Imm32 family immunity protein n=1 Tax=Cohnella cellulosilytica TaxID=986710 RepID=UPI00406BC7A2